MSLVAPGDLGHGATLALCLHLTLQGPTKQGLPEPSLRGASPLHPMPVVSHNTEGGRGKFREAQPPSASPPWDTVA